MIFVHGKNSMENRWFPVKIFPTPKVGHESDQFSGVRSPASGPDEASGALSDGAMKDDLLVGGVPTL